LISSFANPLTELLLRFIVLMELELRHDLSVASEFLRGTGPAADAMNVLTFIS
jgi:hypothetical protein